LHNESLNFVSRHNFRRKLLLPEYGFRKLYIILSPSRSERVLQLRMQDRTYDAVEVAFRSLRTCYLSFPPMKA